MSTSTTPISSLPSAIVAGVRIVRTDGRRGTVSRIIAQDGALGGLVEVRWDGQKRPSRSNGFEAGRDIRLEA